MYTKCLFLLRTVNRGKCYDWLIKGPTRPFPWAVAPFLTSIRSWAAQPSSPHLYSTACCCLGVSMDSQPTTHRPINQQLTNTPLPKSPCFMMLRNHRKVVDTAVCPPNLESLPPVTVERSLAKQTSGLLHHAVPLHPGYHFIAVP